MNIADFSIFVEPQQGASYDQQLAVARRAELLGFGAFFRSDHYLRMGPGAGLPGPTDSWVTLAGLARETSTIRLGTLVSSATFRTPGVLAVSVAQVDEMSGGRVEFGLGAGWFDAEHSAYGIEFPEVAGRFDRFEEQLSVISGLWNTPVGETFCADGPYYPIVNSPALPKPRQLGGPPIIIGGSGARRTPSLAARYAAEFNSGFRSPETAAEQFERVRRACSDIGRDPETMRLSVANTTVCGVTEADFVRRAAATGREPSELRQNALAGTVAEVAERLLAYRAAGAQRFHLQVNDMDDLDHLDVLAGEVAPLLA